MQWTEAHDIAFQKLKDKNIEHVCLKYLIPIKCVVLQIDATQIDPGTAWLQFRLVTQASKVLTPAKR